MDDLNIFSERKQGLIVDMYLITLTERKWWTVGSEWGRINPVTKLNCDCDGWVGTWGRSDRSTFKFGANHLIISLKARSVPQTNDRRRN